MQGSSGTKYHQARRDALSASLWSSTRFVYIAGACQAELIGGIEFPQGAVSFADSVVSFSPGLVGSGAEPSAPHLGAGNALGAPNYAGVNSCASQPACSFVSLGDGGSIVLRFVDNKLTGSDSTARDLHIFEVGPDVEDTFVDISKDGITWYGVGKVFCATSSVDIDAFGWGKSDVFEYVRLTDDGAEGGQSGITVGADIDAVGAISSVATPVPEPGTWLMLLSGMAGVAGLAARRRRCAGLRTMGKSRVACN